jgi:hypothetical protein
MGLDRAIVCGYGHFITVRKTKEDGWCCLDSEKENPISIGAQRQHRETSRVEGKPWYGAIFSFESDIPNVVATQLAHY